MRPASELRPDAELARLPLVTLYLSDRCNSRCVSCDYWRHGSADMNLARCPDAAPRSQPG